MANVMFKRGAQSDLAKYLSTGSSQAIDGAFYLTKDTNRLYVGKNIGTEAAPNIKAVPVNQGVITVQDISYLPGGTNNKNERAEAGYFYYATNDNVLCVYSGQQHGWVQINPDTNTKVTSRSTSGNAETDFVVVTDIITTQNEVAGELDDNSAIDFTSKFAVQGLNGVNVTIDTYKDGLVTRPIIKISQNAYTLKSSLSSDETSIDINLTDGYSTDKVTLKAGDNIDFSGTSGDANIVINAKDTTLSDTITNSPAKNELKFTSNGELVSSITDSSGNKLTTKNPIVPTITFAPGTGTLGQGTVAKFGADSNLVLDVYSTAQVDSKFRDLDAMVYRGTVGKGGAVTSLPSKDVKIGDTYKFISEDVIGITTVLPGDIVIARGEEDSSTGYIKNNTLTWDIVPSGNDAESDTTYWTESIEAGTTLVENDGSTLGNPKGGIQIINKATGSSETTYLTVENDPSVTAGTKNTVNKVVVKHNEQANLTAGQKTVEALQTALEQETGSDFKFSIPVLTLDKAGHITKVESQELTVKDTKFEYDLEYLKTTTVNSAYDNNGGLASSAILEASLKDMSNGVSDKANFSIKSSTLVMHNEKDGQGNDTGNLLLNIEWGSF